MNAAESIADRQGEIQVTVAAAARSLHKVGSEDGIPVSCQCDHLRLEVSDTGGGIAEENRPKIFGPSFSTKAAGHGMGLAIVRNLVRMHDGTIRLVNRPGRSTTFQVLLPCKKRSSPGK